MTSSESCVMDANWRVAVDDSSVWLETALGEHFLHEPSGRASMIGFHERVFAEELVPFSRMGMEGDSNNDNDFSSL